MIDHSFQKGKIYQPFKEKLIFEKYLNTISEILRINVIPVEIGRWNNILFEIECAPYVTKRILDMCTCWYKYGIQFSQPYYYISPNICNS